LISGTEQGRARQLLQTACDAGKSEACWVLAICYIEGRGGDESIPKAKELLGQACKAGHEKACARLQLVERVETP
jgi:TPR repeat protein